MQLLKKKIVKHRQTESGHAPYSILLPTDSWSILAIANTQFGQEMALVMQTTHAQRWQYPDRVDKRLFSSIENVHRSHKNPWFWL